MISEPGLALPRYPEPLDRTLLGRDQGVLVTPLCCSQHRNIRDWIDGSRCTWYFLNDTCIIAMPAWLISTIAAQNSSVRSRDNLIITYCHKHRPVISLNRWYSNDKRFLGGLNHTCHLAILNHRTLAYTFSHIPYFILLYLRKYILVYFFNIKVYDSNIVAPALAPTKKIHT